MLGPILATEFLKLRRSKITWLSWLAFAVMPLAAGLFMWIAADPERAARMGLLGQKSQLVGMAADWPSFFTLLIQEAGAGGMILLAVIASYVFGREYSDGTAKDMLALPVSRHWFAVGKLAVVFVWFATLTVLFLAEALLVGAALRLPGFSLPLAVSSGGDVLLAGVLGFLLVPVVTWIATLGRGYLAPIGFTIFMLLMGNILGATGWGKWFPWSIVPMLAGMAGPRAEVLAPGSLAVVGLTFVAGVAATLWQLRYADNAQ
ncbi:MAG: ABC transporter permease [Gemmatimonadota bacterium]|jgi:ABC-type transport system involved in multi-copper enzyme maturation permease subunit